MTYILIVDEDEESRQSLSRMIAETGVAVQGVSTGAEAMEFIGKQAPAIIFLDLLTLSGDGMDLLTSLRAKESTKTIPIAMVSSFTQAEKNLLATPEVRTLIQQEGMSASDLVKLLRPAYKPMTRQAVLN